MDDNFYKIDRRSRQDLLQEITKLACSYTPEWKFDPVNPDAASVIGLIFADQSLHNIKKINQILKKYQIEFANLYGTVRRPAIPAQTICTFRVNETLRAGAALKKGMQVLGTNENGEEILFALEHDLHATAAALTDILAVSGAEQRAVAYQGNFQTINYTDGQRRTLLPEGTKAKRVFWPEGENIYKQAVMIQFRMLSDNCMEKIRLRFQGDLPSETLAEIVTDKTKFLFFYRSGQEILSFEEVVQNGEYVDIKKGETASDSDAISEIILEQQAPADRPVILQKIELYMEEINENTIFLWNGRTEDSGKKFMPFSQQPVLYDAFFIGQKFLFGQAGIRVALQFRLDFEQYTQQDTVFHEPDLRLIKRRQGKQYGKLQYRCWVQEVTFAYFNGKGWKKLVADHDITTLFSEEQNAGIVQISFVVPSDWEATTQGGYEGNCIRIQVVRADNCYMQGVVYYYPVISDFRVCLLDQAYSIVPRHIISIRGTVVEEVAQQRLSEGWDAFPRMPYAGEYMFLGFDRPFGQGPTAFFIELEKQASYQGFEMAFAYSAHSGFKPLRVFDGTNNLQNSGLILFMPPTDMALCEVEGVMRYWIRLEDQNGYFACGDKEPPVIKAFYINAGRVQNTIVKEEQEYYLDTVADYMQFPLYASHIMSVNVWVNEKEQLSNEEMTQLLHSSKFKTRVEYNFLGEIEEFYVLWHEVDAFDAAVLMDRCYCVDREKNVLLFGDGVHVKIPCNTHGVAFKASVVCCDGQKANIKAHAIDRLCSTVIAVEEVTNPIDAYGGTDLEDTRSVLRRAGNIMSSRKRMVSGEDFVREALAFSDTIGQAACITDQTSVVRLVLLMKDYQKGDYSFRAVADSLREHLQCCCEITCTAADIQIVQPVFVQISLDVWLTTEDLSRGLALRQTWTEHITNYLAPATDAAKRGWQIGKLPETRQIQLMLNALESTAHLDNMDIMVSYTDNGQYYETSLDRIERSPYMVCCNGLHHIYLTGARMG